MGFLFLKFIFLFFVFFVIEQGKRIRTREKEEGMIGCVRSGVRGRARIRWDGKVDENSLKNKQTTKAEAESFFDPRLPRGLLIGKIK